MFLIWRSLRIYGKEVLAQREISQQLIRLKTFYARTTVQSKRKEELSHFGWYSIEHWITNPLTLLNPSLISVVDYRGFRVVVYPLSYRPPLEIEPSSLNITTRLYRELHDLKCLMPTLKLKSVQGENVPMLLRLEERNVGMVLLYKVTYARSVHSPFKLKCNLCRTSLATMCTILLLGTPLSTFKR